MIEEIKENAMYCLNCKMKPCSNNGCPLNNNIPEFIEQIKEENYEKAYEILCDTTVLQAICGRICPHDKQCEGSCTRGIKGKPVSIGELEAFVGDYAIKKNLKINAVEKKQNDLKNKKIAIVGGGPAGLTCAAFLAKNGVDVTIFERYKYLGGLLVYGIPEFRLSKEIVKKTIEKILDLGIKVEYEKELGKNLTLEFLEKNFEYIFLSFGANVPSKMGIEGENLSGVYGANSLLEFNNHPNYIQKTVIINGGGNVAIDIARTVKKLGAKDVFVVYRRGKNEMPAEENEIDMAEKEGIQFLLQHNTLKINGNQKVESVELIKTKLIQKDEKRLSPVNIEESNYIKKTDYVIMALGSETDEFVKNLGLDLDSKNNIKVDENYQTSNPKIYAGGDLTGGTKTIAWAAKTGRCVAKIILNNIKNKGRKL